MTVSTVITTPQTAKNKKHFHSKKTHYVTPINATREVQLNTQSLLSSQVALTAVKSKSEVQFGKTVQTAQLVTPRVSIQKGKLRRVNYHSLRFITVLNSMCGRYGLSHKKNEIEEFFQVELPEPYAPRYNIAPTQPVLIVRENPHSRSGLEAVHVVWGLIPPWADDIKIGQKMINARCETAADKPSFRHALRRRRCVVPVSGFYEWQKTTANLKQPYWITAANNEPLALGGMWETWDGPNGEQVESCTILTTSANQTISEMHERMPVIVPQLRIPMWLDTRNEDVKSLSSFLAPAPPHDLKLTPVSRLVNSVRNDGPELIQAAGLF